MNERLIFHVDVNSAFLSWEAMRRVKNGEPDLRLIPSCIGGNPESRRGVVLAKSIPAKAFKIKTGEPIALALRKCPRLVIAKPDFGLGAANTYRIENEADLDAFFAKNPSLKSHEVTWGGLSMDDM